MRVGPARPAIEGMCARADAQIGLARPVFQVVAGAAARQGPIGDLVMLVARRGQPLAGALVEVGAGVVVRQKLRAVAAPTREYFPAQAAALVNFQEVNRRVLWTQRDQG